MLQGSPWCLSSSPGVFKGFEGYEVLPGVFSTSEPRMAARANIVVKQISECSGIYMFTRFWESIRQPFPWLEHIWSLGFSVPASEEACKKIFQYSGDIFFRCKSTHGYSNDAQPHVFTRRFTASLVARGTQQNWSRGQLRLSNEQAIFIIIIIFFLEWYYLISSSV